MSTSALASLRYPASFAVGGLFTMTLFWVLWSFTNETFQYRVITAQPIEFTRPARPETLDNKRAPKVVREAPPIKVDMPPIDTRVTGGGITSSTFVRTTPELNLGTGIAMSSGTDREAIPMVRVEPTYPPRALRDGTEGWVRVQFNITAAGGVSNATAAESEPGTVFDDAAVSAVSRWRYSPRVEGAQAVERVGMQTLIRFTIEEE